MKEATILRSDLLRVQQYLKKVNDILSTCEIGELGSTFSFEELTPKEKIDHIFTGSLEFFGLTKEQLQKKGSPEERVHKAKRHMIVLLFDKTGLTYHDIAAMLGYKTHGVCTYHYNNLKEELSDKLYASDKEKLIHSQLTKHLHL